MIYSGSVSGTAGPSDADCQIKIDALEGKVTFDFYLEGYSFKLLTVTKKGTYNVEGVLLKESVTEINSEEELLDALNDGDKEIVVLGENISLSDDLVIARPVTIAGQGYKIIGNLIVDVPDVVLKDLEIQDDLKAASGVAEGDLTLENVVVTGKTTFSGGGSNSVHLLGLTHLQGQVFLNKIGRRLNATESVVIGG